MAKCFLASDFGSVRAHRLPPRFLASKDALSVSAGGVLYEDSHCFLSAGIDFGGRFVDGPTDQTHPRYAYPGR
jgi:hypothetical protein